MLLDGIMKLAKPAPVVDSFVELGIPDRLAVGIGILEIACIAVFLYPRTAVLGAILATGYLGGAMATQMRAEAGLFPLFFPMILGGLLWAGLLLRHDRLRELVLPRR